MFGEGRDAETNYDGELMQFTELKGGWQRRDRCAFVWKYDGAVDALYVRCSDEPIASTTTVNDNVNVDLTDDGTTVVGIEVLNVQTATFDGLTTDATSAAFLVDVLRACREARLQPHS